MEEQEESLLGSGRRLPETLDEVLLLQGKRKPKGLVYLKEYWKILFLVALFYLGKAKREKCMGFSECQN